jgi:hypothetical protein
MAFLCIVCLVFFSLSGKSGWARVVVVVVVFVFCDPQLTFVVGEIAVCVFVDGAAWVGIGVGVGGGGGGGGWWGCTVIAGSIRRRHGSRRVLVESLALAPFCPSVLKPHLSNTQHIILQVTLVGSKTFKSICVHVLTIFIH